MSVPLTPRKMLSEPDVLEIVPISRSTLLRWCSIGAFPKPATMGPGRMAWFLDEIIRWQDEIAIARDLKAERENMAMTKISPSQSDP